MRLKPQTFVLTTAAHQRRRVFQRDAIAELFIATLFRYRDQGKFQLHALCKPYGRRARNLTHIPGAKARLASGPVCPD